MTSWDGLLDAVQKFNAARGWRGKHEPMHLAMSVAIEAGELLECFQWKGVEATRTQLHNDPAYRAEVAAEMADVFIYLVGLADAAGVRLDEAVLAKLAVNEERFPPKRP